MEKETSVGHAHQKSQSRRRKQLLHFQMRSEVCRRADLRRTTTIRNRLRRTYLSMRLRQLRCNNDLPRALAEHQSIDSVHFGFWSLRSIEN
jgi:hypothetical protein